MNNEQWEFKYSPQSLDEMIVDDDTRKRLDKILKEVPSLMLIGSPGIGKGTFVNILLKHTGYEYMKVNGSHHTGIDYYREIVDKFARGLPDTEMRFVVINESGSLTRGQQGAQKSLKDLIEEVQKNTRFIFMTNDDMEDAIKSRCHVIEMGNPPGKQIFERLLYIGKQENIDVDQKTLAKLIKIYYPDIRSIIRNFQLNCINFLSINVSDDKILSTMTDSTCVSVINTSNDIITDVKKDFELWFSNIQKDVKPYVSLFDGETIDLKLNKSSISLSSGKQTSRISFIDPDQLQRFVHQDAEIGDKFEWKIKKSFNDNDLDSFSKIKKVGNHFGKVYFTMTDGIVKIEATDKSIPGSNLLSFDFGQVSDNIDVSVMFEYNYFSNLLELIKNNMDQYTFSLTWFKEHDNLGIIMIKKNDGTEKYIIKSKKDD